MVSLQQVCQDAALSPVEEHVSYSQMVKKKRQKILLSAFSTKRNRLQTEKGRKGRLEGLMV